MSVVVQLVVVGLAVAGALGYVLRHTIRTWSGRGNCGCGAGSCPKKSSATEARGQ
jgi:hypothetical protein